MPLSRRQALLGTAAAGTALLHPAPTVAQAATQAPGPANLRSGDFLWPKKPGAFVPYDYQPTGSIAQDQQRWTEEKNAFVARARSSGNPNIARAANEIEPLSYDEFRAIYLRGQVPGQVTPYGLDNVISVGHIAIVDIDNSGQPWVIEALLTPGVVRSSYDAWLQGRPGEIVWQGRLKAFSPEKCATIAPAAKAYLGTRYDFWDFNLADTSGFYCSKLVWLSVMRSLNFAVDDNPNPVRVIWLSPKQILNSKNVDLVFNPGCYGCD
jgi:Permuted papain-like amidase enzyme, YaeF/YiiX, C92 family